MEPSISIDASKKEVTIKLPLIDPPRESKSGKTLVIASTQGNQRTATKFKDGTVTIGVNAYVPNPDYER